MVIGDCMKYGESLFDILYIIIAIVIGIKILLKGKDKLTKLMGYSILILGCGDSFHLIPRVLNYFINYDFNMYLGIGKLITSVTMTIFYIFMYYIYLNNYDVKENKIITYCIWILSVIRIVLCLLPQTEWLLNNSPFIWGIIRNIPFVILGLIIVILFFNKREKDQFYKNIWLYVLLSFIFYIVVVLGASSISILGMFMLPKTICYILIMIAFKNKSNVL